MADNTDEKHLDNPINNQSENPIEQIIPNNEPETINPTQQTETMEVHHHAHNPAEPHHKKNWKGYFWEFLMLFLAVFCGFLAEYQLEHKIERDREKQFMQSMVDDLKIDTTKLARTLKGITIATNKIDTALRIYTSQKNQPDSQVVAIGKLIRRGLGSQPVIFTNSTSLQLKYSGNMRLIRNKLVSDSIISYWNKIEQIENYYNRSENYRIDAVKLGFKIFNFLPQESAYFNNKLSPLLDNSPILLGEYMQNWAFIKSNLSGYSNILKNQRSSREKLIELIRKEYNIE